MTNELAVVNEGFTLRDQSMLIQMLNSEIDKEGIFQKSGLIAKPKIESEGKLASEHKGLIDVFDMERIDSSLGEDLKTKFEIIASSYKFRKPGSFTESPPDITVVEEMCELNS
jgi:hypothetical protein